VEKLSVQVSLKISPALKQSVDELAKRERRSMNQLFTMAMELLLESQKKRQVKK